MNNKAMSKVWWIVIGVFAVLVLWTIFSYNNFVSLEQGINGKWSEVESQYQRQYELIPNLVSVVSSSVSAETKFVKDVTEARTRYQQATSQIARDKAGVEMTNGISAIVNAVAENYPQLKANAQYVALTDELPGTQNRITTARGRYIQGIQQYNTAIMKFPGKIFASIFGFSEKEYYQAESTAMTTPKLGTGTLPQ